MKLVGFTQVYNELSNGHLKRYMDSIHRYCDALVLYDDGCTDGSIEYILDNYPNEDGLLKDIHVLCGSVNDFKNEITHKQLMLDKCNEIGATHIFWMDCDEVLEFRGESGGLRELCKDMPCDAYKFKEINLYRSEYYQRLDSFYDKGWFVRLWKNNGSLKYNPKPGLHRDQFPDGLVVRHDSDIKVLHYGFASDEWVKRKYHLYKSHGQAQHLLDMIVGEATLRVVPADPALFRSPPEKKEYGDVYLRSMKSIL